MIHLTKCFDPQKLKLSFDVFGTCRHRNMPPTTSLVVQLHNPLSPFASSLDESPPSLSLAGTLIRSLGRHADFTSMIRLFSVKAVNHIRSSARGFWIHVFTPTSRSTLTDSPRHTSFKCRHKIVQPMSYPNRKCPGVHTALHNKSSSTSLDNPVGSLL